MSRSDAHIRAMRRRLSEIDGYRKTLEEKEAALRKELEVLGELIDQAQTTRRVTLSEIAALENRL